MKRLKTRTVIDPVHSKHPHILDFFSNSITYHITCILIHLAILIICDIKGATFSKEYDIFTNVIFFLLIIVILIQMLFNTLFEENYFFQFDFFIDLLALIQLFYEVTFISDLYSNYNVNVYIVNFGKVARLTIIARHITAVEKIFAENRAKKLIQELIKKEGIYDPNDFDEELEKLERISDQVKYKFFTRFVYLSIFLFTFLPFFSYYQYPTSSKQEIIGLRALHYVLINPQKQNENECVFITNYFKYTHKPLYISLPSNTAYNITYINNCIKVDKKHISWNLDDLISKSEVIEKYRKNEYYSVYFNNCFENDTNSDEDINAICLTEIYFDNTKAAKDLSMNNLYMTFLLAFTMIFGLLIVIYDIKVVALKNIDRMVYIATMLKKNPLLASNDLQTEFGKDHKYETEILEKALRKIGILLQTSLGEAGATIIKNVLKGSGKLDMSQPGKKVTAVFGFIKIPRFMECTECLLENIVMLVNELSSLIHTTVKGYHGSVNKNIGDSYLIVWKLDDEIDDKYIQHKKVGKMGAFKMGVGKDPKDLEETLKNTADNALACFISLIVECKVQLKQKNSFIAKYTEHPVLNSHKWTFDLMYGLHIGWAIEGAIGSIHKIDASYLSPHVNIAARLEQATHQYGVDLLFSDPLYNCLSPALQNYCRKIDCVLVKGSQQPIFLYTFDIINYERVLLPRMSCRSSNYKDNNNNGSRQGSIMTLSESIVAQMSISYKPNDKNDNSSSSTPINKDKDNNISKEYGDNNNNNSVFQSTEVSNNNNNNNHERKNSLCKRVTEEVMVKLLNLQKGIHPCFFSTFCTGYTFYSNGAWDMAKKSFNECLLYKPNDGPTKCLLRVINSRNDVAPPDWQGFRELTSKY